MADPENHTLRLLQDIRGAIDALATRMDRLERNQQDLKQDLTGRIDSLRQAMLGESMLGRYATAEFEERVTALEQRVSVLERRG